jgi:hypothetical protein
LLNAKLNECTSLLKILIKIFLPKYRKLGKKYKQFLVKDVAREKNS